MALQINRTITLRILSLLFVYFGISINDRLGSNLQYFQQISLALFLFAVTAIFYYISEARFVKEKKEKFKRYMSYLLACAASQLPLPFGIPVF